MLRSGHPEVPAAAQPSSNGLIEPLLASLEALAAAGQAEAACRIAGQACAALRQTDPRGMHRFNALLHRLVRRLEG